MSSEEKKRSFPPDSTPISAHVVASIPPLRVHPMAPASRSRQDVDAWKLGSTVVGGGTAKEVVIDKSNLLWFVTILACQMSWVQHVPTMWLNFSGFSQFIHFLYFLIISS